MVLQEFGKRDGDLGRRRQVAAQLREDVLEHRHHLDEQERGDADRHDRDHRGYMTADLTLRWIEATFSR